MNSAELKISKPFIFNLWKHHLQFIIKQANKIKNPGDLLVLNNSLLKIGDSLMDLYTGTLSPRTILLEITESLMGQNLFEFNQYVNWINSPGSKFQKIFISDGSFWMMRLGADEQYYIHIHPGKHSRHTVRVRSNTLKTAIIAKAYRKVYCIKFDTIENINFVRKKYLNEPPIKKIIPQKGLAQILTLLDNSN
jgi:hypothetical protein